MPTAFETYIKKVEEDLRRGNATEYTYRGSLENLIESFGKGIDASNDPKHIACGAPDFIVEKGKVPLGYIETKDIGADLDKIEHSDQVKRYLKALNNVLLTDYLEFRWYVNGEKRRTLRLASIGKNDHLVVNPLAEANIAQLFGDFFATETPTVNTPKELAQRLAAVTHFIREQIISALQSGDPDIQKSLEKQYTAFKELLLPALKQEEFADLYAQAMTYGLFAAKLSAPEGQTFSLMGAYQFLFGNKFLRRLFSDVSEELDEIDIIRPYLQDIVSLLNRSHMNEILADFGKRTRTEDPVVHFYETFLAAYDPKMRESRGVYYTPEPVVQFIVRAVDDVLKTRFNKPWGLADDSVKVLDPAAGTGTFLYYVIQQIHHEVVNTRGQAGQWAQKSKALIKRLFGFELLIAPYVVSHLKLGLLLKELGTPLEGRDERLNVYLTNTLEEGVTRAEQLAGMGSYIAEESSEAARVKKAEDIMVVLGNPPYSANSANDGEWITNQIRDNYYPKDEIKEHNPKLLLDDYVKFIRYGEYRITKNGQGVLAFITNHAYLDNPTFRGMRKHLMKTFDEIYVLDLHGNSKKKEKAPDGSKDENVFDIQQGVAIFIGIKSPENQSTSMPSLKHTNFWGLREQKYTKLSEIIISDLDWRQLQPEKPFSLFIPQNTDLLPEYNDGWKITDIFPINSTGIKTHRDKFAYDFDKVELIRKVISYLDKSKSDYEVGKLFNLADTRDWKLSINRKKLRARADWQKDIISCTFRPFDERALAYVSEIIELPKFEVFLNNQQNNLFLLFMRQVALSEDYSHFLVSEFPADNRCFTSDKGALNAAPLYRYLTSESLRGTLFEQTEPTREPNLTPAFIKELSTKLKLQFIPDGQGDLKTAFGPEDVFYYAYAVFHSPTYRTRYAEFLKIDFPRLPLTSDKKLFGKLVKLGKELVDLHLLRTTKVEDFITTYPVSGENKVEKVVFADGKVHINPTQYFGGVPSEVWQFKIGGYQVCDKWLKDRKGRVLSGEDITHYQRVVVALKETIRLMKEIDETIPKWPME